MKRLLGLITLTAVGVVFFSAPRGVWAQDTPAAKATRERLKKIGLDEVDWKEEMARVIFADLHTESNKKVSFKIDTSTGMSMNSRMTYKAKKVSLEKILNDLADKYEFGWFVFSDPKNPNDQINGKVIVRKGKGKERGYEAGKEPKEKSSRLEIERRFMLPAASMNEPNQRLLAWRHDSWLRQRQLLLP